MTPAPAAARSAYLPAPATPAINPALLSGRWPGAWCRYPDDALRHKPAVFLFRRTLTLAEAPARFVVHVSADARYELWVNGAKVCWGPARGDLLRWRYETVDLAPHLQAGENVLSARVTFFAHLAPMAQISAEAGFLVQGDTEAEHAASTPGAWKVWHDTAYSFSEDEMRALGAYCCIGPSEFLDLARHPHGWERPGFDDNAWPKAVLVHRNYAAPHGLGDAESQWWLVPRSIPAMEETPQPFGRLVRVSGIAPASGWASVPDGDSGGTPLVIGPGTRATLLFDHGHETCAFPEIVASGGAGATVRLAYAEALVDANNKKGNRNDVEGRTLRGYGDTWTLDGSGGERLLRPTWWRTFRYAELTVETKDAPVTVSSLRAAYTGYPFAQRARFDAPELSDAADLVTIGWRTARLCAHETYMDCPYYEQLQYAGDTRIQCLVSLYTSGDARLFRNALEQLNDSRFPDGLTMSRYPSRIRQVISPFSLWWVGMVHDYWRHVPGDDAFIRSLLPGVRGVLDWFRARLRPDGLLGPLQWWNFVDWAREWPMGVPSGATDGGSSIVTLQYALALLDASALINSCEEHGETYSKQRRWLIDMVTRLDDQFRAAAKAVQKSCFDRKTMRVADTPEKKTFSQHAAVLAVLADAVPEKYQAAVMERVLSDPALTQATFYFRFYLNRALVKAGLGDRYLDTLGPWRDMKAMGLTTWAENPEPTRSDCHAWSSSPNYEFLATVLGVTPGGAGFCRVRFAPHLGPLTHVAGSVPHPKGEIQASYHRAPDGTLTADLVLPNGVPGELVWRGQTSLLFGGGAQQVTIKAPSA